MSRSDEILFFWFGEPRDDKAYYDEWHSRWFTPNPQFDQETRERFTEDYQKAAARQLADWRMEPRSGLAVVLLLDQFPRNMFRGKPQGFATDALAREVATHLIQAGVDRQLLPVERAFVYMPFMHSEALADQHSSVALFQQLAQEREYLTFVTFAITHHEVVERFGRFPHRNAVLGRVSTAEEAAFLTQPGSSF
ncbi:MAG: DUF924 family protein [Terriglobia bacterium]